MSGLLLHRGGQEVKREDLALIAVPQPTETYCPISHYDLANTLRTIGQDILKDYALVGENYAIARNGNQMFACLKFQTDNSENALSFAFRNSLDKSVAVGFACGLSVFVCDNLALNGDIVVMKKHTKGLMAGLEDSAITTLYRAQYQYNGLLRDCNRFKALKLDNDGAYKFLGLLFGRDIISPRMIPVIKEEWMKPRHKEFAPRTAYSFYQAVTEALKQASPMSRMERQINAHRFMLEDVADHMDNVIDVSCVHVR